MTLSPGRIIFFDLWNVLPIRSASLKMLLPPEYRLLLLPSLPTSSVNELDSEYCSTEITGDINAFCPVAVVVTAVDEAVGRSTTVEFIIVMDFVLTV